MLMLVSRYSIALYRGCSEKRPWGNFYILTTYMCIVMQLFFIFTGNIFTTPYRWRRCPITRHAMVGARDDVSYIAKL